MSNNLAEDIARKALRIDWWDTEMAARRVAEYAATLIEELEVKLARVLELALEECPFRWGTPSYEDWWHHRRTIIAELKGQDDE